MLQLLKDFDERSVKGWFVSEKFDGVRAYWNGFQFLTRNHNIINVPSWFSENMPDQYCDGELWLGYNQLEKTSGLVRQGASAKGWENITFKIFDLIDYQSDGFARQKLLASLILPPHCEKVPQTTVKNNQALDEFYQAVIAKKGEGVVMKDPRKNYIVGRSYFAMRKKPNDTAEARVIRINRHSDLSFKSLHCFFNGHYFDLSAGLSMENKLKTPNIGDNITIKYSQLTSKGLPRSAVYISNRNYE
jgi:DNA ligase-1